MNSTDGDAMAVDGPSAMGDVRKMIISSGIGKRVTGIVMLLDNDPSAPEDAVKGRWLVMGIIEVYIRVCKAI